MSLHADAVRDIRGPLLALFGAVGVLLLIACVNVASLLIARSASRTRETAVRVALGAGNGRLFRQHLIEGLLLTTIGAIAGLVVARWGLDALLALAPPGLSRLAAARINGPVVAFSLAVVFMWGVLLSMAPLSELWRVRLANAIRIDAARTGGAGQGLRTILISTQIAMSVILVVGALLLVRTFVNVQAIDPGFNAGGIYSFRLASRPAKDRGLAFGRQLQAELAALTEWLAQRHSVTRLTTTFPIGAALTFRKRAPTRRRLRKRTTDRSRLERWS